MWDVLLALLAVLGLTAFLTLYARLPAALGPRNRKEPMGRLGS